MRVWLIQDGETLPYVNRGAREMRSTTLANALVKDGAEVLWWASTFDHSSKRHLFPEATTLTPAPGLTVRLLHGPGYDHNQSFRRILHQRSLARAFAKEVTDFSAPNIIVVSLPVPELVEQAVRFGKNAGVPVIVFVEDMWPDVYLTMLPYGLRWLGKVLFYAEFRRSKKFFKSATAIFSVSQTYMDWALRRGSRKKTELDIVFPLGYPPPVGVTARNRSDLWKKYGVDPNKFIATFAGVFGFSYDLETVIKAAKLLSAKGENRAHFVLIGDGDNAKSLRESAATLPNVTFTNWLNHRSVYEVLSCSDMGLLAYHSRATQSLPYKPFEYMAAGLPLLSSLPGELSELIQNEKIGVQYKAGDGRSLAQAVEKNISNGSELSKMSVRSSQLYKARFSTDIVTPMIVRQIKKVLSIDKPLNSPSKIWLVTIGETVPGPNAEGRLLRTGSLAKYLSQSGCKVTWWTSTFDHFSKSHLFERDTRLRLSQNLDIHLIYGPGYKKNISLSRLHDHWRVARDFATLIRLEKDLPDIIVAALPTIELSMESVRFGKERGIPVVIDIRDMWPDIFERVLPKMLRPLVRLGSLRLNSAVIRALKGSAGITGISELYLRWALKKADLRRRPSDVIFPLGCPPYSVSEAALNNAGEALARRGVDRRKFICWFVGTMGETYDLSPILATAEILKRRKREEIQFVFSGSGDRENAWKKIAADLPNVIFTGWIDAPQLEFLGRAAKIGIMAYAEDAPQGLPNKLFEYLSFGLPVVSSLKGEAAELLAAEKCGISYENGNPEALAEILLNFAHRDLERVAMGRRAKRIFEAKYSTEIIHPRIFRYLQGIISISKAVK